MKFKLGQEPYPKPIGDGVWFPCVTIHPKKGAIPSVGEKIEAEVVGEVTNVRKDPSTGEVSVEISLKTFDTELASNMEKAGY